MSKEAAFLANNWILLFSALFVLFATLFPTITEAINGERLTVGPPFFNRWMMPIGLIAAAADRRRAAAGVAQVDDRPTCASSSCGRRSRASSPAASLVALGVRVWSSGICFALSGFVARHASRRNSSAAPTCDAA